VEEEPEETEFTPEYVMARGNGNSWKKG